MLVIYIALYESRLLVLFLPPYSPNLNPIERYWRHLKDRVYASMLGYNVDALRDAIVNEPKRQNDFTNNLGDLKLTTNPKCYDRFAFIFADSTSPSSPAYRSVSRLFLGHHRSDWFVLLGIGLYTVLVGTEAAVVRAAAICAILVVARSLG